jgi:hypothetical protein
MLRSGYALRIGNRVHVDCFDKEHWETLPANATLADRCNRAWMLKQYWKTGSGGTPGGPSFRYWYSHVEWYDYSDEWTADMEKDLAERCDELLKLHEGEERNAGRRRWRNRSGRKPQRNARKRWRKLRDYVRARAIVLFWCDAVTIAI